MKATEIEVGGEYLTRSVWYRGALGSRESTRGHVRVVKAQKDRRYFHVVWLMRDGSERKNRYLPRYLSPRRFLVCVKEPPEGEHD